MGLNEWVEKVFRFKLIKDGVSHPLNGSECISHHPSKLTSTNRSNTGSACHPDTRRCHQCGVIKQQALYSKSQWKKRGRRARCIDCIPTECPDARRCNQCGVIKQQAMFSKPQKKKGRQARCIDCIQAIPQGPVHPPTPAPSEGNPPETNAKPEPIIIPDAVQARRDEERKAERQAIRLSRMERWIAQLNEESDYSTRSKTPEPFHDHEIDTHPSRFSGCSPSEHKVDFDEPTGSVESQLAQRQQAHSREQTPAQIGDDSSDSAKEAAAAVNPFDGIPDSLLAKILGYVCYKKDRGDNIAAVDQRWNKVAEKHPKEFTQAPPPPSPVSSCTPPTIDCMYDPWVPPKRAAGKYDYLWD